VSVTVTQTRSSEREVPTRISFEESQRDGPRPVAADGDVIENHLAVVEEGRATLCGDTGSLPALLATAGSRG
jgi:hypothetical protein